MARPPARAAVLERSLGHQLRRWLFLCRRERKRLAGSRDRFEVEADRMADAVLGQTLARAVDGPALSSVAAERIQALCDECEEELESSSPLVQACECGCDGGGPDGGSELDGSGDLDSPSLCAGGRPLGTAERSYFEPRFARSFSGVRLHTDPPAAAAAASLGARAFTRGRDIYFGSAEYSPGTRSGRWLLAHELSHVVQQGEAEPMAATSSQEASPVETLARLGEGEPLPTVMRHSMESAFGTGLGDMRIHRDSAAAALAGSLRAEAFTVGRHIAFSPGAYRPDTPQGAVMLAHEIAHALQQRDAETRIASVAATARQDSASTSAIEQDASTSAGGVALSLWAGAVGATLSFAGTVMPHLRTGLRLQRCATRTPDGVNVGPTNERKTFCLKKGTFNRTFGVASNTTAAARGSQRITFEGENTGQRDGKTCDCRCGLYRHWIRGYARVGSATAAKQYETSSCGNPLTLSETDFKEEYVSCIGDNDPAACKWSYGDAPGAAAGLSDGIYLEVKYDFLHQIWDTCQGRSVEIGSKTLNITGSTAPRSITWT